MIPGIGTVLHPMARGINESDLHGYYSMNDASDTTVANVANYDFPGTFGGSPAKREATGAVQRCVAFGGNGSYIDVGDSLVTNMHNTSWSCWFFLNSNTKDHDLIVVGTHATATPLLIWFDDSAGGGDQSGNTDCISFQIGDGTNQAWISSASSSVSTSTWHHLVCTVEVGSATGLKLYLNGSLVQTGSSTNINSQTISRKLRFGADDAAASGVSLLGNMSNVGIWNRVLTAGEVTSLYNSGIAPSFETWSTSLKTDLIGMFPLEDPADQSVVDRTINRNVGRVDGVTRHSNGKVAKGIEFKRASAGHMLLSSSNYSFTTGTQDLPFSINLWLNPISQNTAAGTGNWFVSKRNAASGDEYQLTQFEGSLRFTLFSEGNTANKISISLANPLVNGVWQMLTATYDGSGTTAGLSLYLNRIKLVTSDASAGTYSHMVQYSNTMAIGQAPWSLSSTAYPYNGYMDEVSFHKTCLNQSKISWLYNGGDGRDYSKYKDDVADESPYLVTENMVLHLDANKYGGSGSWRDLSGCGNDCNWNNQPTFNKDGYFTFNGSSNYGTITANAQSLNFSSAQTVMMWLYHSYTSGRKNPWNQAYGGYGTWTHENGDTMNCFWGDAGSNASPYESNNSGTTPRNQWNSIAHTRDTARGDIYLNGSFVSGKTHPYGTLASTSANILIGDGYVDPWAGNMMVVLAYDRALSAAEILQNHNYIFNKYGL